MAWLPINQKCHKTLEKLPLVGPKKPVGIWIEHDGLKDWSCTEQLCPFKGFEANNSPGFLYERGSKKDNLIGS